MKLTNKYTIEDLIAGCKAGKKGMQELLYKQTAAPMLAVCARYAKDQMEAEDILQNGYIKIFNNIQNYRGDGSAAGWIRRIMVNTAVESYRKNLRMLNVVHLDEVNESSAVSLDSSNLEMKDLLNIIQKLAVGYRIVFNMYVIEGFTHKEIAEELGISEATSKSQLSRARAILKNEILKMEGINYATYTG